MMIAFSLLSAESAVPRSPPVLITMPSIWGPFRIGPVGRPLGVEFLNCNLLRSFFNQNMFYRLEIRKEEGESERRSKCDKLELPKFGRELSISV